MRTNDENQHALPVDWHAWRAEWQDWRARHAADLRPTSYRFAGKNFMADEILGTWSIDGRAVELSEVTFRICETTRYVGLTFAPGTEPALAGSWFELDELLFGARDYSNDCDQENQR